MFHPSSLFTVERQNFGNQRRRGEATAPEGGDDKGGGRGRRERVLEILRAQHREEFGGDAAGRRVVLPPCGVSLLPRLPRRFCRFPLPTVFLILP